MRAIDRRALFSKIVHENLGKPCPCCQEMNEADALGFGDAQALKLFQKYFGTSTIDANTAVVAFRLVPIPRGIEKRGEAFFYLAPNLKVACSVECRDKYQHFWEYHPGRQEFIDFLVTLQAGTEGKKKVKVVGGRIR